MTQEEVLAGVQSAVKAGGGEMSYQAFQDSLPPVVQMSLPRHLEQMRVNGEITLAVRFNVETLTTDLFISVPTVGGA